MTERKRLTDRQFFTSQTVKNRFETMVNTQARRCNCPVIVEIIYDGKQPDLGWSGFGGFILINAGHAVLAPAGRNRALRYELCYAVLSHELGHVMYSDVILMEHMLGRMRSGKTESVLMLPECEEEERRYAEEIIRRAGDDLSHEAAAFLLQEISNCVEDGYIEKRLGREYEGGSVGISLELMREYMKAMESGGSVQGDGTDLLRQALAVLHSLCVYGGDIHGFPGTEGLRTSCGPLIEEALGTDAPDARWKYAVRIFLGLWGCFDPDELIPMAEKYYAERASERKDGAPLNVRFSADRLFDNDVRTLNRSALEEFLELDEEREAGKENLRLAETIEDCPGLSRKNTIKLMKKCSITADLRSVYDRLYPDVVKTAVRSQRAYLKELSEAETGGRADSLYAGRHFSAGSLYRQDLRYWYNDDAPMLLRNVAVSLVVDESGSMFWEKRYKYARIAAMSIYEFLRRAGIPVAVYGHDAEKAGGRSVTRIRTYTEFRPMKDDLIRMADIGARSENHDGKALRYVMAKLLKRQEPKKLMIILCDGLPSDLSCGYYGKTAFQDLRSFAAEAGKKGIMLITAGIGEDAGKLRELYGNRFLCINDAALLPGRLISAIKNVIGS